MSFKCKANRQIYSLELGPTEELDEKEECKEEDLEIEEFREEVLEEPLENCVIFL